MTVTPQSIVSFWLQECEPKQWYTKDDAFDEQIRSRFGRSVEDAIAGELDGWTESSDGLLALVVILDQFTRNLFRGDAKSFAGDERALALSLEGQRRGYLDQFELNERYFLLMPMMHSEDLAIQEASLPLFKDYAPEAAYEYAIKHRDIVERFGRFPHRNDILGRESTDEEVEFLKQPGSSF